VLEYLFKHSSHPTVEEIYRNLVPEIPTLSRTTVYNALNLFSEKDLVCEVNVGEKETRYDANTGEHAHFKCNSCGRVYDVWIEKKDWGVESLEGFKIEEKHLYYRGICPRCSRG